MRLLQRLIFVIVVLLIVGAGLNAILAGKYVTPIMMYHHVEKEPFQGANYVSSDKFEWHLASLKRSGYRILSLDELVSLRKSKKPLPRNSVVITFDDGYANNYHKAFPVLKKYGFPATIFVVADLVGTEGYLTWEQMREMEKSGITIGSHTLDHAYLPDVSADEKRTQIVESKRILEEGLGHSIDFFAYPSGGFDEAAKTIAMEAGYKAACTTNRGFDRFNVDLFELNRIRFSDKDNFLPILWVKLSGYYNLLRNPKDPY